MRQQIRTRNKEEAGNGVPSYGQIHEQALCFLVRLSSLKGSKLLLRTPVLKLVFGDVGRVPTRDRQASPKEPGVSIPDTSQIRTLPSRVLMRASQAQGLLVT